MTRICDGDGHVLEPLTLWQEYIDPGLRERALVRREVDGYEYLEIDGAPFDRVFPGTPAFYAQISSSDPMPKPGRFYADEIPFGAADPAERIAWMDERGVAAAVLYPTVGLSWECGVTDPDLSDALARAYNRWIVEFCSDHPNRLIPAAHISMSDPELAAREVRRAVQSGCRGAFVAPFNHRRAPHGGEEFDPLWAAAQDLGVPVAIHPTWEPEFANTFGRFDGMSSSVDFARPLSEQIMALVLSRQKQEQAFATFFVHDTFERFPRLRLGVLESGAGWVSSFLERLDTLLCNATMADRTQHTRTPTEQFVDQCFVCCDLDESAIGALATALGPAPFVLGTDFPHPDHTADVENSVATLANRLPGDVAAAVLVGNITRDYLS